MLCASHTPCNFPICQHWVRLTWVGLHCFLLHKGCSGLVKLFCVFFVWLFVWLFVSTVWQIVVLWSCFVYVCLVISIWSKISAAAWTIGYKLGSLWLSLSPQVFRLLLFLNVNQKTHFEIMVFVFVLYLVL